MLRLSKLRVFLGQSQQQQMPSVDRFKTVAACIVHYLF